MADRSSRSSLLAVVASALVAVGFGLLGFVGGHALTYETLEAGHHHTGAVQADHAYLAPTGNAALLLVLVAWFVLLAGLARSTGGLRIVGPHRSRVATISALLAAPSAYVAAEFIERLGQHATPPAAVLVVGIVIQVALALLALLVAALALDIATALADWCARFAPRIGASKALKQRRFDDARDPRHVRARHLAGRAPPTDDPLRA